MHEGKATFSPDAPQGNQAALINERVLQRTTYMPPEGCEQGRSKKVNASCVGRLGTSKGCIHLDENGHVLHACLNGDCVVATCSCSLMKSIIFGSRGSSSKPVEGENEVPRNKKKRHCHEMRRALRFFTLCRPDALRDVVHRCVPARRTILARCVRQLDAVLRDLERVVVVCALLLRNRQRDDDTPTCPTL